METHLLGFLDGECPRLVQDPVWDQQLADVVQQRRPLQLIDLDGAETELLAEGSAEGTYPFGVAASGAVVNADCGCGVGGRSRSATLSETVAELGPET